MTTALVLTGHGSHISPQTARLVWEHVDALRAMGVADEVTAAFWKEAPSFSRVFQSLTADDITVIPLFTAQGYFTRTVIPTEMGLSGPLTVRAGRTIRYTQPLGEHPILAQIVRQRVEDGLTRTGARREQVAVAIIGHSTRRHPESRLAAERQADLIRAAGLAGEVVAVYLEDAPGIPEVYTLTTAPTLLAVPYFLAAGSHTTLDVPERLGLAAGQAAGQVRGRQVYYLRPVGSDDSLHTAILELAQEAGAPLKAPAPGSAWECFPAAGRDELIAAVRQAGALDFGQLHVTLSEFCRIDEDVSHPIDSPGALRRRVREAEGGFRPLATADDLPGGWRVRVDTPAMLHAAVETVYPGAVGDWAAARRGQLAASSLERLSVRQTGIFRELGRLDRAAQRRVVADVCGHCVRQPIWFEDQARHEAGKIPCAEPCNLWLSEALKRIEMSEGEARG